MKDPMIHRIGKFLMCSLPIQRTVAIVVRKATAQSALHIKKERRFGNLTLLLCLAVLLFAAPAAARAGTVNGALFVDVNVDGVKQAADTGAGGLPVILKTAGGNGIVGDGDDVTIDSDTTDGVGNYSFTGVAAGTYYVQFDLTPFANAFMFSPKDQGSS